MFSLKKSLLASISVSACALLAQSALAQNAGGKIETVIVTGTRVQGMTAADSPAPITVLGSDALTQGSGSQDIRQSLGQMVPAFQADNFGTDLANVALSANLRALSPNDTLVLVNGQRRHTTATFGLRGSGGSSADLSMIPTAAIDHVEVLLEGAAAQYGSDAIAGVVNIILKKKSSGGQLMATTGRRYSTEGEQYDISLNMGLPLFDKGYIDLTLDKNYRNYVQLGGPDGREFAPDGSEAPDGLIGVGATPGHNTYVANAQGVVPCTAGVCMPLANRRAQANYPRSGQYNSSPELIQTTVAYNAGYDINDDFSLYSFGTWAHRNGRSRQVFRLGNQNIATPGSNQPCTAANPQGYLTASSSTNGLTPVCFNGSLGTYYNLAGSLGAPGTSQAGINKNNQIIISGQAGTMYTPGELIQYPNSFEPLEQTMDNDYQYNVGTKFNVVGWDFDASIGYGKDTNDITVLNTGNRALFIDTHTSPTSFYAGSFMASEFIGTIGISRNFNVGMASPLNVAFGLEARDDVYQIKAGDAGSRYKEGPQSFPGYQFTDAGIHERKNYSAYVDLALSPVEQLTLDVAGRAEHYSDFGDTQIGKLTARYDFTPQWAVRGTISTGFRAPTLPEEYYSATSVSPTAATVVLSADSPAAKIVGLQDLGPEVSTNYSVGVVAHPLDDLSITVDAYSIAMGGRIINTSTVHSTGTGIISPLVGLAILAHGNVLDPTAGQQGVSSYVNGLDTLTEGVDLTVSYLTDFDNLGSINWTLAGNYNQTAISDVSPPPAVLLASNPGATFFTDETLYNFVHRQPNVKVGLSANWSLDQWGVTLRETVYGSRKGLTSPDSNPPYVDANQPGVGITDLEVRYNFTDDLRFAVGGNNIFNIAAEGACDSPITNANGGTNVCSLGAATTYASIIHSPLSTEFDPYGGYYYARISYNF